MRLIDANALMIDLWSECPESDVCISNDACIECVVKRQPVINRWIPCSERMPAMCENVMILTDDDLYAIAHVTGNEDDCLWFGDGGHYSKDYVLFWMPLPEPPEVEEARNSVVHGEWEDVKFYTGEYTTGTTENVEISTTFGMCSVCKKYCDIFMQDRPIMHDFCPNCGADMRGGERRWDGLTRKNCCTQSAKHADGV